MKHIGNMLAALALLAGAGLANAGVIYERGTWQTTLHARNLQGQAVALDSVDAAFVYDSVTNLTWLADMNAKSGSWQEAMNWAGALNLGGFDDWRLPTVPGGGGCNWSYDGGTDCGHNVQTESNGVFSEWAHLYYVTLGNLAFCAPGGNTPSTCEGPQAGWNLVNTAFFQNFSGQGVYYWTDTHYAHDADWALVFDPLGSGVQFRIDKRNETRAVAVRVGDVLSAPSHAVPEPAGAALVLAALGGWALCLPRRRRLGLRASTLAGPALMASVLASPGVSAQVPMEMVLAEGAEQSSREHQGAIKVINPNTTFKAQAAGEHNVHVVLKFKAGNSWAGRVLVTEKTPDGRMEQDRTVNVSKTHSNIRAGFSIRMPGRYCVQVTDSFDEKKVYAPPQCFTVQ